MHRRIALVALAATLLPVAGGPLAAMPAWPRLSGDMASPTCQQAHRLAVAAFSSTNATLAWPMPAPDGLGSAYAVHRTSKYTGDRSALAANERIFSIKEIRQSPDELPDKLFWQIEPRDGRRLVVADAPFNWRGDWFYVFLLDAAVTPEALSAQLQPKGDGKAAPKPIIGGLWTPPLVLTDAAGALWFIDLGESGALSDWWVYAIEDGKPRVACHVQFHPLQQSRLSLSLLPAPVHGLAALLDEALGPGKDEGTLRPTARIRGQVADAWANAALRPWALVDAPYNTRDEVEAGLTQWAAATPQRAALLRNLHDQTPAAERALAAYYRERFQISPSDARQASAYVVDYMLRSYFVFSRGGALEVAATASNPWPEGVRAVPQPVPR